MSPSLVKKPVFWVVVLIASALCMFSVFHWFGEAFSVLELDVRMSRTTAIDVARTIERAQHLVAVSPREAVARFDGDGQTQTFIELEGGGKPALKPFLGDGEFTLYHWDVRLYSPDEEREATITFTPDGRLSGFVSRIPQNAPGAALSDDAARAIAVAAAARDWGVDFADYRPLTASSVTQPGKRVDHDFVYERQAEGTPPIGEGRLRLNLTVAGDRLTQLRRSVFVPEAFTRRYATLRAANNNIATGASVFAGIVYGLGGCLVGVIWLMRRHALRWGPAVKWAAVVALLIVGASLAAIPGSWFGYDTATSASTHLNRQLASALVNGVVTWLLLAVVFATAEGLGRLAFGEHPQLWRAWHRPAAQSREIWGRTLAGYAWIGFDLAFIALFYFVVDRYLGWWSPSDALIDPNILGTPAPWVAPTSMALQAGMMEESLFRAVPLAGAALLGRRFGREKRFVVVALVLQAIVFGCAHANYPGQPAYARPVELFVPALIWGIVYLRFGLLPGILFHFGFDLVLMSIPLFATAIPGIGLDRAIIVAILALPLLVLIVQRLRGGRLIDLPDSERNAAGRTDTPAPIRAVESVVVDAVDDLAVNLDPTHGERHPVSVVDRPRRGFAVVLVAFAIVGSVGIGLRITRPFDAPALAINRDEAFAIAEATLRDRGVQLDQRWRRSAVAVGLADPAGAHFVWREGGAALFAALMDRTVPPPHWVVRFARFEGDVAERDTWSVAIVDRRPAPDGVRVVTHDVPEARPGPRLGEAEARTLADAAIVRWMRRPVAGLRAVSARAVERPARVDWQFVYADPAVVLPAGGEGRIAVEVDGDEVVSVGRQLFVPEAWSRDETRRNEFLVYPRGLLSIAAFAFGIVLLVTLVRRIARGEASARAAWVTATVTAVVLTINRLLDFNASEFAFRVTEPYDSQVLRAVLLWFGSTAAAALISALVAAVAVRMASALEATRSRDAWRRWSVPVGLALLAAGIGGYSGLTGPALDPAIPAVGAADRLLSPLGAFLAALNFPGIAALLVLMAAVLSWRSRRVAWVVFLGFVVVAMLGRAAVPGAALSTVVLAGVAGAAGWWIFRTWLRDRPADLAPLALCIALAANVVALASPAFPGARMTAALGLVGSLVGYRIWRWLVERDRDAAVRV